MANTTQHDTKYIPLSLKYLYLTDSESGVFHLEEKKQQKARTKITLGE